jgi:predicted RND superfamily exporter protein
MKIETSLADFDPGSGNRLERLIFNNRRLVILFCAALTVAFAAITSGLRLNASYEKVIPTHHPFVQAYLQNRDDLHGLGTSLRIVVESPGGDIFNEAYLNTLKDINDELFLTPGVDRAWMKSLWTPSVRWTEVTEQGFQGGPVMPAKFDGSSASMAQLKLNIARAGLVGSLIANDFKSTTIFVPLLDKNLDYRKLSAALEHNVRQKFALPIHIVGFAKIVGDLLDGIVQVTAYFAVAFAIAGIFLYLYTKCIRSTLLVLCCSLIAVIWQLGLLTLLGFDLDPYSLLVPFLVFAIGVSHGAQKMNGIMQDVGRGMHKLVAARQTFRRLFLAGMSALLADAVGFAVLMVIDIPVIRELAMAASLGVGVLIFTNLILLPVLLSYTGVNAEPEAKSVGKLFSLLDRFAASRNWAIGAILVFGLLAAGGYVVARGLQVGDLDPGAPELRPDSRYNRDNAYVNAHYSSSGDVFAVIVKTPTDGCLKYETLIEADRLSWALRQLPSVQSVSSLVDAVKQISAGSFEGNPKFFSISRNQGVLNYAGQQATVNNPDLFNVDCSVMPVLAYLADHKASTLEQVRQVVMDFAATHDAVEVKFLPAAGSAGIEVATNAVVAAADRTMLVYVYGAVMLLCLITFRSWRAVLVAVIPLAVTSVLCEALMVRLGIGVKVATLPVIALGVGIGVDYALYLVSVQLAAQRLGQPLAQAYAQAVQFTGRVVALVGLTLAAAVVTWAFSPIKFQADMGLLLTFMFLWNMIGALVLTPALSYFLLNPKKGS